MSRRGQELGDGFSGRVIVDPSDEASCLKIPLETDPDRALAELVRELAISEVVAATGVPHIPFDLVYFMGSGAPGCLT